MLVWSRRADGESSYTQRSCLKSEQPAGTDFSRNSRIERVLKLSREPPGHASSPTQCFFFIGHGLHPCIACFPVVTLLILPTARCISQLHPPGSSQVKRQYITKRPPTNIHWCLNKRYNFEHIQSYYEHKPLRHTWYDTKLHLEHLGV